MHLPSTAILLTSLISTSSAIPVWTMLKAIVHPSASTPFTLTASHQNSPIDGLPIHAQQNAFYIGNTTESFCPPHTPAKCPPGNVTALQTHPSGTASMDVAVPAGQSVYVNTTTGALRYTVAHSNVIAAGAKTKSFALFKGATYNFFTFSGVGKASGFLACPVNATVWQVFADLPALTDETVPEGNLSACVGFDALANNYKGVAAWQYE